MPPIPRSSPFDGARTCTDVAADLGLSLGPLHTHLRRIRLRRPELEALSAERRRIEAPLCRRPPAFELIGAG